MVANYYRSSITDGEYVQRVRRHAPSSLLPLIAQTSAQYWEPASWLKSPFKKYTPWALADIARVSLISGNESRSAAAQDDLLQCCAAYVQINDPELGSNSPTSFSSFFLRITAEQNFSQTPYNELGRAAALFQDTQPSKQLKVIKAGWDIELFGCSLSQYVGTGFFVQAVAATSTSGRFDAQWFDAPQLDPITAVLPVEVISRVANDNFVASVNWFKSKRHDSMADLYRRFTFNPLLDKPVVAGITDELLVPSIWLVLRKISPLGIYYSGAKKWGNSFTDEVGDLFEQYIGRQLKELPETDILPEIVYDNGGKRSVDWIVVSQTVVILVEVKSVRPTEPVRMGTSEAGAELQRMLGKAHKQINNTDELIAAHHPDFAHIPDDRPRVGLIVTMEPFGIANAPFIRGMLEVKPNIPTNIAAAEDVERLLMLKGESAADFLLNLLTDPEKDGWRISTALSGRDLGRNAVLDQAWDSYEWGLENVLTGEGGAPEQPPPGV